MLTKTKNNISVIKRGENMKKIIFILILFLAISSLSFSVENKNEGKDIEIKKIQEEIEELKKGKEEEKEIKKEEEEEIKKEKLEKKEIQMLPAFGYDFFAQPPSTFAPVPSTPVPSDYPLGVGDEFKIVAFSKIGEPTEYSAKVDYQGQIFIPAIGKISVLGMTLEEFQTLISNRIKSKFPQMQVYITLTQPRTIRVFVAGEAKNPGGYLISGISGVFNALYVAGGPNERGTLRKIKLIRRNKEIAVIDLYDYLLYGNKSSDYLLEDGDTIFIPVVGAQVKVVGEVKRPAVYELKGGEKLRDIINISGGIKASAYSKRIQIERIKDNQEKILIDVDAELVLKGKSDENNILLKDGDVVSVLEVVAVKDIVYIEGNITRPGVYQWKKGMKVIDLIEKADGLRGDKETYLQRADIFRMTEDKNITLISFNLKNALSGDERENLELQPFDRVKIYSPEEAIFIDRTVKIEGAVKTPGVYKRTENMKVSDLLNLAGGLLPEASDKIIISRVKDGKRTENIEIPYSKILNKEEDIILEDRDIVSVRAVGGYLRKPETVRIEGEVKYPGVYAISENETLYSLIKRAGGLTENAFLEGAIFKREISQLIPKEQEEMYKEISDSLEKLTQMQYELELARYGIKKEKEIQPGLNVPVQVLPSEAREEVSKISAARSAVTQVIATAEKGLEEVVVGVAEPRGIVPEILTKRLSVDLSKIVKTEGKEGDIELKPGDYINIPKIPNSVMVVGAVINPGNIIYKEGKKINYYIEKVGGYSEDANRKKIIVIKPNGEVISGKKIKNINRGDIVIVPPKPLIIKERKDWWEKTKDVVKLITDTATAIFVIRSMEKVATK